jgi:SAM-dependent methyltransferase
MDRDDYTGINARTIDRWVAKGWEWGQPISHEEYLRAQRGEWRVVLTPCKPVPKNWFPDLRGAKVLGLAGGGGQQMPIFTALGAQCTVLDYADAQLASEKRVAEREGYQIELVKADMTKPLPFADERFDLIFHPVANVYIEEVCPLWRECVRVLKPGGILMAGLDNGLNFLIDDLEDGSPLTITNRLPFNPLKDPALSAKYQYNDCGVQFSHTAEEQLGGQLKAGLILRDLYEDHNNAGRLKDYAPTYWATLAVKP